MTDSFADLWSSAAPANSTQQQPRKLGDHQLTPSIQPRKPQNDAFSLLAAPNSLSGTRSSSPLISNGQSSQNNGIKPVSSSSNGDAFSSLLSESFANTTNAKMTIAERAAKVEQEKIESLVKQQESVNTRGSPWRGLESLDSTSAVGQKLSATSQNGFDDEWIFDAPVIAKHSQASSSRSPPVLQQHIDDDNDWGLSDFTSAPTPQTSKSATVSRLLWDLDETHRTPSPPRRQQTNSPGDFDFGDREDRLLDDDSNDEDDVLGVLSKPTDRQHSPNNNIPSRSLSPPPHIIGQIVEMGFSPQQARMALAATSSGIDVQAALDMLLADNAATSGSPPIPERAQSRPIQRSQGRPERNEENEDHHSRRQHAMDPDPSRGRDLSSTDIQKNIQEQADKLLTQASEIGLSMFTRANAFWSQGKGKVQRVYEERRTMAGGSSTQIQNGRPKWMQDGPVEQDGSGWEDQGGFRKSLERDAPRTGPEERLPRVDQHRRSSPSPPPHPPRPKIGNLIAEETPTTYQSPYRRGPSRTKQQQTNDRSSSSSSSRPTPQRVPSPIRITHRTVVSASASAIATSTKHKVVGTELFKLGRFSEAENAYSLAITALPDQHLLRVQLYNNRALCRLRTGDHSGSINDSSYAIKLIGASYHPAREAKVTREEDGAAIDLADGLMKAYRRRAEAYEGKEKWDLSKKDWEVIAGTEWATGKMRTDAVVGIGRCRKMVTADLHLSANPAPRPQSISKRPSPRTTLKGPSEALKKLRAANNAADAEDQEKYELKDSVDAKIAGWKTGKEDNIRALVASLETVLWPQLGWQKVGMHELVTPAQVKAKYTKAIAKLHPDKLNVNGTSLEHRMIANAVFGALNEAWNAFKP